LAELTGFDPGAGRGGRNLFETALIQLEESALALRRYQDRLELDPARLAELDQPHRCRDADGAQTSRRARGTAGLAGRIARPASPN
jgi:hypothetical protein